MADLPIIERFLKRQSAASPEPRPDFAFDDDGSRPIVGHTLSAALSGASARLHSMTNLDAVSLSTQLWLRRVRHLL